MLMRGNRNTEQFFNHVLDWKNAAVVEDWSIFKMFGSEDISRAFIMKREGFTIHIINRKDEKENGSFSYDSDIAIWGPDGLAISVPEKYSMDAIRAGLRTCNACGKTGVDTFRYSFAGRCCAECLPKMREKYEYPGWTN